MTVVYADYQTSGRGCGRNKWHSERGKNLLFSILTHPHDVPADCQFVLSMAEALGVKRVMDDITDGIQLKWPNDLYWHDRKLGGTLIETTLTGRLIRDCIFGTGININQAVFPLELPNPVSLAQITGRSFSCEQLMPDIAASVEEYINKVNGGQWAAVRHEYMGSLYRMNAWHDYRLCDGSLKRLMLIGVADDGHAVMKECLPDGTMAEHRFAFKEIEFVL